MEAFQIVFLNKSQAVMNTLETIRQLKILKEEASNV